MISSVAPTAETVEVPTTKSYQGGNKLKKMLIHVKRQRENTPPHTEHRPWRTAVTRDSTSCASQRHTTTDTIHHRITESILEVASPVYNGITSVLLKFEVTATTVAYAEASGQGFRIERSILPDVLVFSRLLSRRRSNRFSTQNGTHLCWRRKKDKHFLLSAWDSNCELAVYSGSEEP